MRRMAILLYCTLASSAFAVSPRVTFTRTLPAPYSLGAAEEVAIVRAAADPRHAEMFIDVFLGELNRSGFLRGTDARHRPPEKGSRLALDSLACREYLREGEGGIRDAAGARVRQRQEWIEASCTARIDVLSSPSGSFTVRGAATSPRVVSVTPDEREAAVLRAVHYAARHAAEQITPRRIRESIALDESSPGFEEGLALIEADRLGEARELWERRMRANPRSAPLHFNLAALCEALGDRPAAENHYAAARQLDPAEPRYSLEMRLFKERRIP